METIIIGIGNPVLTDDSVGLKIAGCLAGPAARPARRGRHASCAAAACGLMEAMAGHDRAIIIDAIDRRRGQPGNGLRVRPGRPSRRPGIPAPAMTAACRWRSELGEAVGLRLPRDVRIWAVEAGDVSTFSEDLTPEVRTGGAAGSGGVVRDLESIQPVFGEDHTVRVGVYFCTCGGSISERWITTRWQKSLGKLPQVAYVRAAEFLCSEEGKQFLEQDLAAKRPDRVVIAACSPARSGRRLHAVAADTPGLNPYFLQIANIREQVAWVTPDPDQATAKACAAIRAAVARVCRHEPLERKELDACRDVLVVGAGPAGLKAALAWPRRAGRWCWWRKRP